MPHLLKLGPVELASGCTNVYFRVGEDGAVGSPTFGSSDLEVVRQWVGGEGADQQCFCEPALEEAARAVGVSVLPAPGSALKSLAAIAVFMAWKQRGLRAGSDIALLMVEAASAFWAASPWQTWNDRERLVVFTSGDLVATFEGSMFGREEHGFGVALYERPGSLARLFDLQEAGRFEEARQLSAIGVSLDVRPAYATQALTAAGQVPRVPIPIMTGPAGITTPGPLECLAVVAALQALAVMGPRCREATAEAQSQGQRVAVRVIAPPPRPRN